MDDSNQGGMGTNVPADDQGQGGIGDTPQPSQEPETPTETPAGETPVETPTEEGGEGESETGTDQNPAGGTPVV